MRALFLFLFLCGAAILAAPFIVSSLYVDQRGVTIPGRVFSKSETVGVRHSSWSRSSQITVEYQPPDWSSTSFFTVTLDPERYDSFHVGQPVAVRYLLRKDIPDLPLSRPLREMHMLPMARLADQRAFAGLTALFSGNARLVLAWIGGGVILLVIWRMSGWPKFGWAVAACVAVGSTALLIQQFPTPTPAPAAGVRTATGRIKSIEKLDRLFRGTHSRGIDMLQPVEVAGIEFVPEGKADAVVAVDLIDAGSIPGLKQNSTAVIEYEAGSPRTAYLQNATRKFARRNFNGIIFYGAASIGLLVAAIAAMHWIGKTFKRLAARATIRRDM